MNIPGIKKLPLPILLIIFSAAPAWATTWHVPADFDSVCTAMDAALDGDTILISAGAYPGPFSLNKDLTLIGDVDDPGSVILEVASFQVGPPTQAHLEGLTFSGGNFPTMAVMIGTVFINDCHFENFQMEAPWGITIFHSDAEFRRCRVRNNSNSISMFWISNNANVAFYQCEFLNNSGMMGSAITKNGHGNLLIQDCFFSGNHASNAAGAVLGGSNISINNSRFEGNTAGSNGGAIYLEDGVILDCSFIGNSASQGGALAMDQACDVYIENSDFSNNTASVAGPQGFTISLGFVNMVCCLADLDLWEGSGEVTLDNDGCTVATQQLALESIKIMFR